MPDLAPETDFTGAGFVEPSSNFAAPDENFLVSRRTQAYKKGRESAFDRLAPSAVYLRNPRRWINCW